MNPTEINKRIAIACGWEIHPKNGLVTHPNYPHSVQPLSTIPNYHGDLNAMHEAEKGMKNQQWWKFVYHLTDICGGGTALGISSTAAQRAEAFLRTIGQWEDDK
jgi:hypothetical protein